MDEFETKPVLNQTFKTVLNDTEIFPFERFERRFKLHCKYQATLGDEAHPEKDPRVSAKTFYGLIETNSIVMNCNIVIE